MVSENTDIWWVDLLWEFFSQYPSWQKNLKKQFTLRGFTVFNWELDCKPFILLTVWQTEGHCLPRRLPSAQNPIITVYVLHPTRHFGTCIVQPSLSPWLSSNHSDSNSAPTPNKTKTFLPKVWRCLLMDRRDNAVCRVLRAIQYLHPPAITMNSLWWVFNMGNIPVSIHE